MSFKIKCPNPDCRVILRIESKHIDPQNPKVRCPKCKKVFYIDMHGKKKPEEKTKILDDTVSENALAWLVVHDEKAKPQTYSLKKGKQVVGKKNTSKPCDIMINCADPYMSRNHCVIEVATDTKRNVIVLLSDCQSTNGTWLNAETKVKLGETEKIYLQDNDMLQLGMTKVIIKLRQGKINSHKQASEDVRNKPYGKTRILNL